MHYNFFVHKNLFSLPSEVARSQDRGSKTVVFLIFAEGAKRRKLDPRV